MKQNTIFIILIITSVYVAAAAVNSAVQSPVQSPIGSPTAVPSAGQNGLVPNKPSTYGMSGNMVMTGNVGGGKQFRGFVPYGSRYYSDSYSSPIDNFLRRSAGDPLATDRNPGIYDPYFNPRRTVTSMYRGGDTGLAAPQLNPQGRASTLIPSGLSQLKNTPFSQQERPLSVSPENLMRIIDQQKLKEQKDDFHKMLKKADESTQDIKKEYQVPEGMLLPKEARKPGEKILDKKESPLDIKPAKDKKTRDELEELMQQENDQTQKTEQQPKEETPAAVKTPAVETEESELTGTYRTFADLAEAKARAYMNAAREFLDEGKYYKAADSFALAAVWKPEEPQAWIGQVGSLFAAGEYLSSAYYLSQVLTLKPDFIEKKVPTAILTQNRDAFENNILEAATWQERSQSGELAFLMAYMLWQDGKVDRAKDAIAKAQILIPDSEAINTLLRVIQSSSSQPSSPKRLPDSAAMPAPQPVLPKIVGEPNQP